MRRNSSGFTLIELLVVLAIIGILAGIMTPVVTSHIRKAQDEKCRTNLKQLHTACVSYANDHGGEFPHAQSFEIFNTRSRRYEERRGWISWSPTKDRNIDTLNTLWDGKKGEKSQSENLTHDRGHGDEARFGVEHGVIFEYMNKSMMHYICPTSADISYNEKGVDKDTIHRTYAMNEFFYAPHYPSAWHRREITRIGTDETFAYGDGETKKTFTPEASKLLMFSEIIVPNYKSDKGKFDTKRKKDMIRHGDCVLVAWEKKNIDEKNTDVIMPIHQRSENAGFSFAIFVDGHIEQVNQSFKVGEQDYNTLWFLIRGINPKNAQDLGAGLD